MDQSEGNGDDGGLDAAGNDVDFIEDYDTSEGEGGTWPNHHRSGGSCKRHPRQGKENSPPLLLVSSRSVSRSSSRSESRSVSWCSGRTLQEPEEDLDQPIEDWMILDDVKREEDADIQLNLSYWSSSEDDSCDEGPTSLILPCELVEKKEESATDEWVLSDKDKLGAANSLPSLDFLQTYNQTGRLSKSCSLQKKCPTCVLCGVRGHIQRLCPGRSCSTCGRPSHRPRSCQIPPLWKQHCNRCGMSGHLCDNCPDQWRQYHSTITVEAPVRPQTLENTKRRRRGAHCYNCAKKGHYGHECSVKRMSSATFPSLPYICHYDTTEDVLHFNRMQKRAKDVPHVGSQLFLDSGHFSEKTGDFVEEKLTVQMRSRTKQESSHQAIRRKTWPERRKERREVKRLRRAAQAIREEGVLEELSDTGGDEVCPCRDPRHGHTQSQTPPKKKRKAEADGRRSRVSERWRRKGVKRQEFYPCEDINQLSSPKQRIRHRRR